jgi:hypothetical protein
MKGTCMPSTDTDKFTDLVSPGTSYNQPAPTTTVRGVAMIRLTQVYDYSRTTDRQDVWVNAALIQTMSWDKFEKVTKLSILGREMLLKVAEEPIQVVWLIEQAMP